MDILVGLLCREHLFHIQEQHTCEAVQQQRVGYQINRNRYRVIIHEDRLVHEFPKQYLPHHDLDSQGHASQQIEHGHGVGVHQGEEDGLEGHRVEGAVV